MLPLNKLEECKTRVALVERKPSPYSKRRINLFAHFFNNLSYPRILFSKIKGIRIGIIFSINKFALFRPPFLLKKRKKKAVPFIRNNYFFMLSYILFHRAILPQRLT